MLQERPVWLDVVEAYPPLPPPTLPPLHRTGRSHDIQYPQDELRRYAAIVLISAHVCTHTHTLEPFSPSCRQAETNGMSSPGMNHTLSLFERRSVKRVEQWIEQFPEKEGPAQMESAQLEEGEGPAQLEKGEGLKGQLQEEGAIVYRRHEIPVSSVSRESFSRQVEQEPDPIDPIEVSNTNLKAMWSLSR